MAMTKKERAEFDVAIRQAKLMAALRWTEPGKKDLPVPDYDKKSSGWDFNSYNCVVSEYWSESVAHGRGTSRVKNCSASQNGISLYSTKLKALMALRYAVEKESAEKLLKIDSMIEEERGTQ